MIMVCITDKLLSNDQQSRVTNIASSQYLESCLIGKIRNRSQLLSIHLVLSVQALLDDAVESSVCYEWVTSHAASPPFCPGVYPADGRRDRRLVSQVCHWDTRPVHTAPMLLAPRRGLVWNSWCCRKGVWGQRWQRRKGLGLHCQGAKGCTHHPSESFQTDKWQMVLWRVAADNNKETESI